MKKKYKEKEHIHVVMEKEMKKKLNEHSISNCRTMNESVIYAVRCLLSIESKYE